ncbi:hypothetical protein [Deinococcus kurensis]|uniref:hypothetical protein n=1 Tax=Deinococcus kurensis TaxID=2662757 RepID=UPI0012D365B6|nr:hypothetical protein [Deinococcus kurensis]
MRLTLQPTPEQAHALNDTRTHVSRLMNGLLVQARRHPDTPTDDLLHAHPDAPTLPHATRRAAAQAAHDARHNTRGGLKGESYWLDARSLRLNPDTGHVTLWTLQGRHTIPTRLGNYQRHLLKSGRVQGGRVTQARNGDWYVNVQLDTPAAPTRPKAGADPLAPRTDQLEREGNFAQIVRLLRGRTLTPKQEGQLAIALLETSETDAGELRLMKAVDSPQPDARIFLGFSILAATRNGPANRLDFALRGLAAQPDDFTRWWLRCSQSRALVELGRPAEAREVITTVLTEIPVSEIRSRARALYFAQGIYAALDDFEGQDRYAREALRLFDLLGIFSEGLSLRLDLAYRTFFEGRPDEAFSMIREVFQHASHLNGPRLAAAHLVTGEMLLLSERFDAALEHFDQMLAVQQKHGSDRLEAPARAFRAECLWRMGQMDWSGFERQIEALRPTQEFDHVTRAFYLGLIAFEMDDLTTAQQQFEKVIVGVALMDGFRLRSHAFLAYCRWAQGQALEDASADLLDVMNQVGGELALAIDADRLAALYSACELQNLGAGAARRLSQRARPVLHLRLLGGWEARINDEEVQIRLRKARELLAFLVMHGPATRDQLITALWDGSARRELGSYLKQALHGLREALRPYLPVGVDPVPLMGGHYRLSEKLSVSCDAAQLAQSPHAGAARDDLTSYMTGAFLAEVDSEWAGVLREQLQLRLLTLIMAAGQERQATHPEEAAQIYLKTTQINPLFETGWEAAAEAYEQAGLFHLAQQTRTTLQQLLEAEFS